MKQVFATGLLILLTTAAAIAQQTGQSQQTVRSGTGGFNAISNGSGMTSRNSGTMTNSGRDSVTSSQPDSDIVVAAPKATGQKDPSKDPSKEPSKSKEPPVNAK
jgi:hypothetical protein